MAETVTSLDEHKQKKAKKPKAAKAAKEPKAKKPKAADKDWPDDKAAGGKTRKEKTAAATGLVGRDLSNLRATAEEEFSELFKMQEDMESDMAGYRSDFAKSYDKTAEKLGVKKGFIIKEFKRALKIKREIEKEKMLTNDEVGEIEALRDMFKGTGFGDFFAGKVARPSKAEKEAAKAEA